ncbi:T9SS type A sorting domain-containing protein, partial [bacterium]|nr:T9SS type A sorting domain-containing protein [bacterium]
NDTMEIWDITNDTTLAAPWNGTKGIIYRGEHSGDSSTFTYTFPKASVTALLIASKSMGIEENTSWKVENIRLEAYPNPFNSSCMITAPKGAEIEICDMNGKYIEAFDKTPRVWTPDKSIASGIYFVRATVGNHSVTKKLVLIK